VRKREERSRKKKKNIIIKAIAAAQKFNTHTCASMLAMND
jgi:hypothetical protein